MSSDASQPPWAVTPEKIQEAVRRIVEVAHPLKVILFGSHARGDATPDSDLDLLVIQSEVPDRHAELVRLHRALAGLMVGADIVVASQETFDYWRDTPGNVYYEAHVGGQVVYEQRD